MRGGTIVDATIIDAPSSAKNTVHQTKKGNQWRFGMKAHAGVDAGTGYIHAVEVTSAVHDVECVDKLIREDDGVCY